MRVYLLTGTVTGFFKAKNKQELKLQAEQHAKEMNEISRNNPSLKIPIIKSGPCSVEHCTWDDEGVPYFPFLLRNIYVEVE